MSEPTVTLIERARDVEQLDAWIAEATAAGEVEDGVLPEWLAELHDAAQLPFREKVERTALRHDADAATIEAEMKRLGQRLAAARARAERTRAYVRLCLEIAGEAKVQTPLVTVAIQRNGGRPAIRWTLDPATLPEAFRRPPEPPALDSAAAYQHYQTHGRLPDGFEVAGPTYSLRIR